MLISLHVKNLALIEEEEILFEEGLNILTGETGAGKSVIIGSVNLALGAKADKDLIRQGAESAYIELTFTIDERQTELLKEMELYPEEDNILVIQRRIMPGRSVSKVCGETVNTKQLQAIAEILIDIHGQNDHQSLLKQKKQLEILDDFAGEQEAKVKSELKIHYEKWQDLKHNMEELQMDEDARLKEINLLQFELKELEEAQLINGEDEELEQQYRKMTNSKRIKEAAAAAYRLTGYESTDGAGENTGRALRELKSVSSFDQQLVDLEDQLSEIDSLLNDFNRTLAEYMVDLEFDDGSFLEIENRLNLLNHLKSKYKKSLPDIFEYEKSAQERLKLLEEFETHYSKLEEDCRFTKAMLIEQCKKLSKIRKKNGEALSESLRNALLDLNFEDVKFRIDLISDPEHPTAGGFDKAEFMISTNKGQELKPLSHVASGGELSRIMLALKTVLAESDEINTLIFDEIDAGISGRTAWKVSEKLAVIGKSHQVICITHLPQIAAMADRHYLIEKSSPGGRTVTEISLLEEENSLRELARMLGSDEITQAAMDNAREMKDLARNTKQY